jgi:putative sterol carrier protein
MTEALPFPTDPWFQAFVETINASEEYREAAADWEGAITFVIEAEPDRNVPDDVWAWLDLWHGACRSGGVTDPDRGGRSPWILSASYSRWKDVLQGHLDPVKGMMQGKLKVRGDLPTIVRYVRAANELVRLTGTVPTSFPDER